MKAFLKKLRDKLFGGINLTWPKLIIFAVLAGVFTAAMAIIPGLYYSSFHTIVETFEVWILFGILIIMNSKSNKDSALKCFVFFLISQPLIYLLQVPFSQMGWGLFGYYKYWFLWTVFCLPMGWVGYYMKKDRWWGYLILLPMILLTAYSYLAYFSDFLFSSPKYILISVFCAAAMILYPVCIFHNRKIRLVGVAVGAVLTVALTVYCLLNPPVYTTHVLGSTDEHRFDDSWTAVLEDDRYGSVQVIYLESVEDYMIRADFTHEGHTTMTLTSPTGEQTVYDLEIKRDTYMIVPLTPAP